MNFFFCIFLQSTHQVGMKNVVKCYKEFFGHFNALKTHGDLSKLVEEVSKVNIFFNTAQPCQQKLITDTSAPCDMVELIVYPIISFPRFLLHSIVSKTLA